MDFYRLIRSDKDPTHYRGKSTSVSLELFYQDSDLEILRYKYGEDLFFFRPPVLPEGVKTYQLLSGEAEVIADGRRLAPGDIIILKHGDEVCYLNMRHAEFLVHAIRDQSFRISSEEYERIYHVMEQVQHKDNYTKEHGLRVWRLTKEIAVRLGLFGNRLRNLANAARFHDVGKLHIPDEILNKPSSLTKEEYEIIKQHVILGRDTIVQIEHGEAVYALVEMHHERLDGSGYPLGLRGDDIPLEARILGVVDSYDAMTSQRVYKQGKDMQTAIAELYHLSEKYDRQVVDVLADVLRCKKHV